MYDMIFIQEHWLIPSELYKIKLLSNEYVLFGKSAMDDILSCGMLRGRPFGGVSILLKQSLLSAVKDSVVDSRFVILFFNNWAFINVYCPCDDSSQLSIDILIEMLDSIEHSILQHNCTNIVFGGDLNTNLGKHSVHSQLLNGLLQKLNLFVITSPRLLSLLPISAVVDCDYTFCNTVGYNSTIDYFCVSNNLIKWLYKYVTRDAAVNMSDHIPLELTLTDYDQSGYFTDLQYSNNTNDNDCSLKEKKLCRHRLRWDHGDLSNYYIFTGSNLYAVYNELMLHYQHMMACINSQSNNVYIENCIDAWYMQIVKVLRKASDLYIPQASEHLYKHWWTEDLDDMKRRAIDSYSIWLSAGKPRSGPLFDLKTKDKLRYKKAILKSKTKNDGDISDKLNDHLLQKNGPAFWKMWNNKVDNKSQKSIKLEGNISNTAAVEKFYNLFKSACHPNSVEYDQKLTNEFMAQLAAGYTGDSLQAVESLFRAEDIDGALNKTKLGKAPGHDDVMAEHLLNCHPIIYTLLAKLFNLMIASGFVPHDFSIGVLIPIPKSDSAYGTHKLENFRGITLSPFISKLFEHCILKLCSKYLVTSCNQFGFKAQLGCSHAIYTLRQVIDYHCCNASTLNMCFVDVSKAFDKVLHPLLFIKLMKRKMPRLIIIVLYNWYSKIYNFVQWENCSSNMFKVLSGVRQGGILSPYLFIVYVDDMLERLNSMGCKFFGYIIGAIMYADDLIFMSNSVYQLQLMLELCEHELSLLGLKINFTKSTCMWVGQRANFSCMNLKLSSGEISWSKEVKYLGIYVKSGQKFLCEMSYAKGKFYRSANAILNKLGKCRDNMVALKIVSSVALPTLLYGIEAQSLSNAQITSLEHTWNRAVFKIFSTFDVDILKHCLFYGGHLPVSHLYTIHKMNFLKKLLIVDNPVINFIASKMNGDEVEKLSIKFNCSNSKEFSNKFQTIIREQFKSQMNIN